MKLRFEQHKIVDRDSGNVYNCKDDTDMHILCKDINKTLLFFEFDLKDKQLIIDRIIDLLGVNMEE